MNSKVLVVDYHKCVGCGTCEMICSLVHEDVCGRALSRIRVVREERIGYNVPISCSFCDKPLCVSACPVAAVTRNKETGNITVNEAKCIGCRQCVQACPFGHMNYNFQEKHSFKCDSCNEDPMCVKFCWTHALEYLPLSEVLEKKRRLQAGKIIEENQV